MNAFLAGNLLLFSILALMSGCVSRQFPVLKPVAEISRKDITLERAQNSFIKARDYERRGLYSEAERYYEMAYEADSDSKVLRNLLVNQYLRSRKYARALVLTKGKLQIEELAEEDKKMLAGLYMEMRQFDKAAEALESLNEMNLPEQATLGYLYELLRNNTKAIEHYRISYERNPDMHETGMKLADLYTRERMFDKAESVYVAMESIPGQRPHVLNKLGTLSLLKNDTASAINFYTTALLIDSTSTEIITNLAHIYIGRRDYAKAIEYYKKAAGQELLQKFFLNKTLAILYYHDRQYAEAEESLTGLLGVDPDDFELHFYLALVYMATDRYDAAELELRKTIALKEGYVDAWVNLCYLFLKNRKWEKALDCAGEFNRKMPEAAASWRMYGYALNINKKFKEAIDVLQKSLAFDDGDAAVWFELGSAYERSGNYRKAASAFKKALSLNPEDHAAANYLGYMWAEQGINLDSAKVLLEMALQKEPENGAYLDSYGWIFYMKGDMENAEKYIRKAIQQIDNDPIIYSHLGDILSKKGDKKEAIDAYTRSVELGSEEQETLRKKIEQLKGATDEPGNTPVSHEEE